MKTIIYKITNLVNNKVYIGQTSQGLAQRIREHKNRFNRRDRDHKLYKAFNKYGIDTFKFEELLIVLDKIHLNEFEIAFIKEYNSYNKGYNMTIGGDTVSEETRSKLSEKLKGRKITWYNKILESRKANNSYGKYYEIILPSGQSIIVKNLKAFCKTNNIDCSNLFHKGKTKGYVLSKRFNDYPIREYTQTSGNGIYPASLAG